MLTHAGQDHGLKVIGGRALNALRLEKSFGTWAREFRPIYGPIEAGLGRFVDFTKGDFIGKEAALEERDTGGVRTLVTLSIDTQAHDAIGDEPIFHDGNVVGWVTSGGYGHTIGTSLAMGYVDNAVAKHTEGFAVELVGKICPAIRLAEAPVDPKGSRMRA